MNELNVGELMTCALPYHGTPEFVRLVQTLRLDKGEKGLWGWLARMQESGAPMPRELLVQRCLNDKVGRRPLAGRQCLTAAGCTAPAAHDWC